MITVTTTGEDEARDMREVLAASLPPEHAYRIFLLGREYGSRLPADSEAGPDTVSETWLQRTKLRELVLAAGQTAITEPQLRARLREAGVVVSRDTVRHWLETDAEAGLICRTGSGSWARSGLTGEAR